MARNAGKGMIYHDKVRLGKAGYTMTREGWVRREMIWQRKAGKGRIYYG